MGLYAIASLIPDQMDLFFKCYLKALSSADIDSALKVTEEIVSKISPA